MAQYIILRSSDEQATWISQGQTGTDPGKRFRVVLGGYQPTLKKNQTWETTITGKMDISVGSIQFAVRYSLWLAETEITGYGTLANIQTYFKLNNPNGAVTNLIHLVDHYGTEYNGYLVGENTPEPITTILQGSNAYYLVPIEFVTGDAVA